MEILERLSEPTPKFWKKVRNIALMLGTIGGVIMTAPVSLPAIVVTAGGYLATAGAVATVLSQSTSTMRNK